MYVRKLEIRDLRSFYSAKLEFLAPGRAAPGSKPPRLRNVNVLLGINGSGKSTVLDAIALALLSPLVASTGYRPYALIRRSNRGQVHKACVQVEAELHDQDLTGAAAKGGENLVMRVQIERRGDVEFVRPGDESDPRLEQLYYDQSPAFFFVGYGAMRRVDTEGQSDSPSRRKLRHNRYERVASLFEDHYGLSPLNSWLPDWRSRDPNRFNDVVGLIRKLLPSGLRFSGAMEDDEFLFDFNRTSIPFGALSDGYRAYLGWISDLLNHLSTACPADALLVDCEGVVMVDEIDLHIHPEWQRTIIPRIAKALPRLQFIFTTHSPLVVGTLERANIWVVERERGRPVVSRPEEEVFGLSADQILRSDLFGLESTRDESFTRELTKLATQASRGNSKAALTFMRKAARGESAVVDADGTSGVPDVPAWVTKLARRS